MKQSRVPILWIVAACGLACLWLVLRLQSLAAVLLVSWFLAYACNPLVDRLERRRVPRGAGAVMVLAAIGGCAVAAAFLVVPALSQQVRAAAQAIPDYVQSVQQNLLPQLEARLGRRLPADAPAALTELARALQSSLPSVARGAAEIAGRLFANFWSFLQTFLTVLLIPVFTFYLLVDFKGLGDRAVELLPIPSQPGAHRLLDRADEVLSAFVRGQLLVCAVLGLVYSVGLTFTGIDMPWVVGLLSGALFIVPYLGTVFGVVLGSLLALLKFHDLGHLFAVWAVFAAGQGLEGFVLTPRIVGNRVGLNPLVVMLAVLAGGGLFGFVGVLLAVPGVAVLRVGLGEALEAYRRTNLYRGDSP